MSDTPFTIDRVHPELRPVVQQFLLKCKYPFVIKPIGRFLTVDDTMHFNGVEFIDPNAETTARAGALKWQQGDFGKPFRFRIVTRTTLNGRYRDSERRVSVETQDEKRALKEMLTHIKPFTLNEIAHRSAGQVNSCISTWRNEFGTTLNAAFHLPQQAVIREILNLKALGVEFVTEEFQRLVTDGLPAYHENQKRLSQKIAKHFVKFESNGTINVLSPHGHSVFTSFDLLPTRIQEVVGMLKLVSNQNVPGEPEHRSIPGLGVQVSENAFWVLEEVDTANKAV